MLDKKTKQRISDDADSFSRNVSHVTGYKAGAAAEATRAQGLIECLHSIKAIGHPDKKVLNLIIDTLAEYNNPK